MREATRYSSAEIRYNQFRSLLEIKEFLGLQTPLTLRQMALESHVNYSSLCQIKLGRNAPSYRTHVALSRYMNKLGV